MPKGEPVPSGAVGGGARRSARAPWGSISRGQVVDAATRIVRQGGYARMTIRGLAAELRVAPMSLYRHVRDKDDLLAEVVDRLLAERWRPRGDPADWRAWTAEAAERLRAFLVEQPAALEVYLRRPVVSPAAVERMDAMLAVLGAGGLGHDEAERAYAAIQTYTIGFAALEASRADWTPPAEDPGGLAARLGAFTTPRRFSEGLGFLLDGFERRAGLPLGAG